MPSPVTRAGGAREVPPRVTRPASPTVADRRGSGSGFGEVRAEVLGHQQRAMRQVHHAGEKCFVDYAAKKPQHADADNRRDRGGGAFRGRIGHAELHLRRSDAEPAERGLDPKPPACSDLSTKLRQSPSEFTERPQAVQVRNQRYRVTPRVEIVRPAASLRFDLCRRAGDRADRCDPRLVDPHLLRRAAVLALATSATLATYIVPLQVPKSVRVQG